jgi:hypothetical protein
VRRQSLLLLFLLCGETLSAQRGSGYDVKSLCGVDEFGRTFTTITGTRSDRTVGIFYFLWLGQHPSSMSGIYDITKILAADSGESYKNVFNIAGTPTSPYYQFHYWGEPLYHYYNSMDDYVMRRHVELLTAAGIDFVVFDVTNGWTYDNVWLKLFSVLDSYQKDGWEVPKVAFYTNTYSEATMIHLYNVLYSKNLYADLWFRPDGVRPLIIGRFDNEPAAGMEATLRSFFHFRTSQWPNERALSPTSPDTAVFHLDGFPWIDWQKPQRLYGGGSAMSVMSVSPAQHPMIPFSDSYLLGSVNWGRGFTISHRLDDSVPSTGDTFYRYVAGANDPSRVRTGANFEQEWKLAIKTDPQMVFLLGWNQWVALKQTIEEGTSRERIGFVDVFNEEFSNDLEPMLGGYNDAFYMQLIQHVRRYKGIPGSLPPPVARTIDIRGDTSQWSDGTNVYRSIGSESYGRDNIGAAPHGPFYRQTAPRNNVQEARVTHDAHHIFFFVRAETTIAGRDSGESNWMNCFIGTNQPSRQGWEGYSYVVNRSPDADGTTTIEKLDSTGKGVSVGRADYFRNGATLQLRIPRTTLQLPTGDSCFQMYFKVADGVRNDRDIMDYYVTGKSMPLGRLSYSYASAPVTSAGDARTGHAEGFSLSQNYPNPFNPSTKIQFSVPRSGLVTLRVYTLLGQEVATLVNEEKGVGGYTVDFNVTTFSSGVYVYRMQAGGATLSRSMLLMR